MAAKRLRPIQSMTEIAQRTKLLPAKATKEPARLAPADRSFRRLFAGGDGRVDGPANDARIARLRVADRTGFVNFLAGKPGVGGRRLGRRMFSTGTFAPAGSNLAPFLRGVVFVGEAAFCGGFDFQRISLP